MTDRYSLDTQDREELQEPVYIPGDIFHEVLHSTAAQAHPPVRSVIFILYHTGMRIGELLRLRWRDVNFDANVLHVKATPQKGGDRNPYMVSRQLRLYLRFAKQQAHRAHQAGKWDREVPFDRIAVIPNTPGKPWGYSNLVNRVWHPFLEDFRKENPRVYRKLAELGKARNKGRMPISFHDFRHTFITDMLVEGFNPIMVGWLVGHKELHTQRRYTHLCYSHFQKEFEGFKR